MTGTALGQVIGIALYVVITRYYPPEMFASLEQFAMLLGIFSVIAGGKYDPAIMLPEAEEDARHVLALCLKIALYASLGVMVVCGVFSKTIAWWLGNPDIQHMLILLGPAIFLTVLASALGYWFGRQKRYKPVAAGKTILSAVGEPAKIGFGIANIRPDGLIWGLVAGKLAAGGFLWYRFIKTTKEGIGKLNKTLMREKAREYIEYPKYALAGSLLNRTAQWLHIAAFGFLFGSAGLAAIGFLGLSRRIVMGPMSMLATSFSQVYYQRITEIEEGKSLRRHYLINLLRFLGMGSVAILVVWLLPEGTMTFVFGPEWEGVMPYLRILVFWFAANFAVSSLSFILHRIRQQKLILQLDTLHFTLVLGGLVGAWYAGLGILETVVVFVASKMLYYLINVLVTLKFL